MTGTTPKNASFLLLLGLATAVTAIVVLLSVKTYPFLFTDTLHFCQRILSHVRFPPSGTVPGALLFGIGTVLIFGITSIVIQMHNTSAFLSGMLKHAVIPNKKVLRTAALHDLEGKVIAIRDRDSFSFCFGLFRPKIGLSTGLIRRLTMKELEAVLLHERAHLMRRDPLKVLIGKTIASAFLFLPIFGEIFRNMEATSELIADRATVEAQQTTKFLRHAMRKIIAINPALPAMTPGIGNPDYFEIRISQLALVKRNPTLRVTLPNVLLIIVFAMTSLFLLQAPVHAGSTENPTECTGPGTASSGIWTIRPAGPSYTPITY